MYSSVWIALGGYAAERNHGYITELLLLGSEAGAAVRRRGSRGRQQSFGVAAAILKWQRE